MRRRAGHADASSHPGFDERRARKTHAAHTWDCAEALLQIGIEGGNFRVFVTGLPGIHLEEQQVFTIETEVDRLQIFKRPYE